MTPLTPTWAIREAYARGVTGDDDAQAQAVKLLVAQGWCLTNARWQVEKAMEAMKPKGAV